MPAVLVKRLWHILPQPRPGSALEGVIAHIHGGSEPDIPDKGYGSGGRFKGVAPGGHDSPRTPTVQSVFAHYKIKIFAGAAGPVESI